MTINFDPTVTAGGYVWWYVDALSDDGRHGLTIIALVGSVFSPYYAWARRRAAGSGVDPWNYCALNVALYGAGGKRWALTERGHAGVARSTSNLTIGPSALTWDGTTLTISIDEVTVPIPSRIRGTVRLTPAALTGYTATLDDVGLHRWSPLAPCARVEVEMTQPARRWSGSGYLDSNMGETPLEEAFVRWDWSRGNLRDGGAAVLYDVTRRSGKSSSLALRFDRSGNVTDFAAPPAARLPTTGWRVERGTRADVGKTATVAETLEDTPFYARSVLSTHLLGEPVTAMHESLSLDRFRSGWVQMLLPFRMPRVA
jgi:carotenoid 1,2-hydratase